MNSLQPPLRLVLVDYDGEQLNFTTYRHMVSAMRAASNIADHSGCDVVIWDLFENKQVQVVVAPR